MARQLFASTATLAAAAVLACTTFLFCVALAIAGSHPQGLATWTPLLAGTLGTVLLLVGCARAISAHQHALTAEAAVKERRRMARELHDGLAQELAFLVSGTRQLVERPDESPTAEQLAIAAQRAMRESRSVLAVLTGTIDSPLEVAVGAAAAEVADRAGARLKLDLAPGVDIGQAAARELVRIVREAVTNAVCDGQASAVVVRLSQDSAIRLRVTDNGTGFDPSAARDQCGFGLTSMRERTEALGGEFHVLSRSGFGTAVEVVLP
jgi:signal transduction histidine kinase